MTNNEYKHLLDLTRALRLAQRGNPARGVRPSPEAAQRLEVAIDLFIAQCDDIEQRSKNGDTSGATGVEIVRLDESWSVFLK